MDYNIDAFIKFPVPDNSEDYGNFSFENSMAEFNLVRLEMVKL
jgi:hypothetical protein